MTARRGGLLTLALFLAPLLYASTPASFRGRVVETHERQSGTIFVLSRNGSLRKVEVSRAQVSYSQTIPERLRKTEPAKSLVDGTEVRVMAEENGHGAWRARTVEILSLAGSEPAEGDVDEALPPGHPRVTPRRDSEPPSIWDPMRPKVRRSIA